MELSEVFDLNDILFEDLNSKDEVFRFLSKHLYEEGKIKSKDDYYDALCYRETQSFTGLTNGIAIPHGISDTVINPAVIYVKLKHPIKWECIDDKPVEDVFMLAIPKDNKDNIHIKMLSELARSLMKDEVVAKLKTSKTPKEVLDAIRKGGEEK